MRMKTQRERLQENLDDTMRSIDKIRTAPGELTPEQSARWRRLIERRDRLMAALMHIDNAGMGAPFTGW